MAQNLRGPHFEIPVSPATAEALARLRADPDLDFAELADTAKQIPALQLRVLRAANAASNGLQHLISTPEHAMAILGSAKLQEIVSRFCEQNETLRAAADRSTLQSPRADGT